MALFDELYKLDIFRHVDKKYARALFKYSAPVQLKAGEFLFHRGIIGSGMYFLIEGGIDILLESEELMENNQGGELLIRQLSPVSYFGELCFPGENRRTASARASVKSELLYLDNQILYEGMEQKNINAFQLGINIGRNMVKYVRVMNDKYLKLYVAGVLDIAEEDRKNII